MRSGPLLAMAVAPVLLIGGCLGSVVLLADTQLANASVCGSGPAVRVDPATLPTEPVAGYTGDQLVNAALIINAGEQMGLPARAQAIAVMTAMGESSLQVLDHGDAVGPDSRGLFQQRDNGAWGSYADRMDPTTSATNFYRALIKVEGWQTLPPTIAAHRTQRNADPFHYERYWDAAVAVVHALAGVQVQGLAPGTGGLACTGVTPGQISAAGWTKPAVGRFTSSYGMRVNPVTGQYRLHTGADIAAACDTPIYAAAAGIVAKAGPADGYGNLIVIDHGGGISTRYAHMYNHGLQVRVGDVVTAGQQIALIGSNGNSTGCHLHFEVRVGPDLIDPVPFLAQRGAPL